MRRDGWPPWPDGGTGWHGVRQRGLAGQSCRWSLGVSPGGRVAARHLFLSVLDSPERAAIMVKYGQVLMGRSWPIPEWALRARCCRCVRAGRLPGRRSEQPRPASTCETGSGSHRRPRATT